MENSENILIVEDDKDAREILKIYLTKWNFRVFEASNINEGLNLLKTNRIKIALVDWVLPGASGIDFCKKIRESGEGDYIYIIVITGKKSKEDVVKALSEGADDYIIKPFNFEELRVRIDAGLRILGYYDRIKNKFKELEERSTVDALTGLYNRATVLEKFEKEYERSVRAGNEICVLIGDVDFFKKVNDRYGHLVGDKVLKEIGEIIKTSIRKYDIAGRYGGEEFLIVLPYTNLMTAKKVAERIKDKVRSKAFYADEAEFRVTMSFGIASSVHSSSPVDMISNADRALYNSKHLGRDKVSLFLG